MSYKVKQKFENSSVHYRNGDAWIKVPRLKDAPQNQLEALHKIKHPGVTKEPSKGT